jgi:hypothetical protein
MRVFAVARQYLCAAACLSGAASAAGAQRATQTVTFRVEPINQIAVVGDPVITLRDAVAGHAPSSITVSGGTWAVTTNQPAAKVTASLDSDLPAGLTLSVMLDAPAGATTNGFQALRVTPVELVENLSRVAVSSLPLSYRLDAASTAGVVAAGTRRVVFTITGGM